MHKSITTFSLLFLLTFAAVAATGDDTAALARARQLQLEFRQGNVQVVGELVQGLEAAAEKSPGNSKLWEALGNAYMSQQGAMFLSQPDPAAVLATGERAQAAFARAMSLDGDDPLLRASHGMAGFTLSLFKQDAAALAKSVEEMNAAVRQAPNSTPVRLTRGFTVIHLPVAMRDSAAVAEDLKFVMGVAPGGRPEDVLHVLLGDVYAETGDLAAARAEYAQVTGASRFAAGHARARLEQLAKGPISPASITEVRSGTGARCSMCHAPGTDD